MEKGAREILEQFYDQGLIRATGVKPMLDQVASHSLMNNQELNDTRHRSGIAAGVRMPLGGPRVPLLEHPTLRALAEKYGRPSAQIVLRWDIEHGV